MAVINIRNVPDELHRQLKIRAATESKTLHEIVVEMLTEGVKKPREEGI